VKDLSSLVFFRTLFAVTALSVIVLVVSGAAWPGYVAVGLVAAAAFVQHSMLTSEASRRAAEIIAVEDPDAPSEAGEVAEAVRERITAERHSAERQNADLRAALLSSGVGVIVADRRGRILNTVGATSELLPAGSSAIKNPALLRLFSTALDSGEAAMDVVVMGVRNREMQWIAVPLDADEVGAVVTDVTEMQRVQAMRRNFVTDASHELKTPIAAIQAAAEVLQAAIGTDEDRSLLFARRLEEQAIRLGRIVNDLLDLSRLESDSPEMALFDLTAVVGGEIALAHDEATESDIELVSELEDVEVVGNRADAALAVRNLLTNAIRYTPAGGDVDVVLRLTGEHAIVEVTDSGIGIAASDQDRVFERFFRVDSARSRATGGTGLGLSIVRHIMHHHGGTAEVESVSGQGSTFRLRFPI
jgi:signal transduction histidine kinase